MRVLLQSEAKKTDFVSMSLVESNGEVFVGAYKNISISTTAKKISNSNG